MRHFDIRARREARLGLLCLLGGLAWLVAAPPAAAQSFRHCGQISRNETWTSLDAHIVECEVRVRNSTLTIAANVQVLMNEGVSIVIEPGAKLEILGNPDTNEPVRIVPNSRDQAQGFWGQIQVLPGAEESLIQYAIIFGGGKDGSAMIDIGAVTRLFLVDLRGSGGAPLAFDANVLGPSLDDAGQALSAGICNVVALRSGSHVQNEVRVKASADIDLVDSQFWNHFCMPYRIDDLLTIGGPDLPTLSLNPGVELRFGADAGIVAGADAENPGHFEANGEEDAPILLTGVDKTPGSWRGLEFTAFADANTFNSLFYTRVEYGGSADRAMVEARAPQLLTEGVSFAHAPGYPVAIRPEAVDGFTGGLGKDAFVDNGVQRVRVLADEVELDLPRSSDWKDAGVPLEITGDLRVAGPDVARFYLNPGLELRFADGAGLILGDAEAGDAGFYVRGNRSRPVTLAGLSDRPGSWRGVTIDDATLAVEIDHLDLSQGGAGGAAMLDWGDAEGFMAGSSLHDAAGLPLAIDLTHITAVASDDQLDPEQTNRYADNGVGHILVRVEGRRYGSGSSERVLEWADPGAPLAFDEDLVVAADGGLLLRLNGGLDLRFPAGKGMQLSDTGVRGSLDLHPGRAGAVRMGPIDPAAGWAGLRMVPGSSLDGEGLRIEGVSGDAPVSLDVRGGAVSLAGLVLQGVGGAGIGLRLEGEGSQVGLSEARIGGFGTGIESQGPASLQVERSIIAGNADWGVHSEGNPECQLVVQTYWGSPGGPTDPSDAEDDCMDLAYDGGGDRVSDGVVWWRYAIDEALTPAAGIGPGAITIFLPSVVRVSDGR